MNIKKYIEEFLAYTIGFSQVYLQKDKKLMWIIVETISQLQKVAIIFMDPIILQIIQNKTSAISTSPIDNPYSLFDSLVKSAIPTIYAISNLSIDVLIGISVVLSIFIYCPFWINAQQLRLEQLEFSRIKYKTRIQEGQNNLNHSINLLNRSYNMHNFIEHFLQKQLMGSSSNSSWSASERKLQSKILNIFPHVILTPLMYWVMVSFLLAYHVNMSSSQLTLLLLSNVSIFLGIAALQVFSMACQRTYFITDTNHLRLVQSFWFNISQALKTIPIAIQFIHFMSVLRVPENSEYGYQVGMVVVLLIFLGDLIDNYVSYPFVMQYKQNTILLLLPFCIMVTGLKIAEFDYNNLISVTLFSVPILSKLLIEGQQFLNNKILVGSLYKERVKTRTPVRSTSFLVQGEEQPFVIEREQNIQRDVQLQFLQNQDFRYFIHYLRLVDLMHINDQQSFERESALINYSKSKFIISVIVLLKSHISQCDNVYCYCKGFRGEKRRIMERNFHTVSMKVYSDFDKYNLLIQVDLVRRYIRYYAKLIFELEKNKSDLNHAKISQLITYLSASEESYQTLLLIMEYKSKHQQQSILSDVILTLMTSYTKYQILYSQQFSINYAEIETALEYKDYRMTEVRQDKIIDMIFSNLKAKAELMKKLSNNKFNYYEMQNLIEAQLNVNQKTMNFIETFNEFSNSRTSLLLYMLFAFEVTNNFDKFLKLRNHLKTKSYKFYEYPANMRNNNNASYEACYIKANIARHAKKGKINRGEIIQYSNNTPQLFGYSQRDFAENVVTIHQLVTHNLSIYHDQLIEIFLLTNRPSILRKKRPLLALRQNKDLMFAEMFVDLCFSVTQDTFPVYCFLRKLSATGEYENVRGHLVLNDQLRVEGMSTMALEEFKLLGNKKYLQRRIQKFIPNWKRYHDRLILQYDQYQQSENQKKKQGSISNKIDYNQSELLLNHFSFFADNVVFRVLRPHQMNQLDTYIVECNFQMTVGNIHGNEYKSFLIQFSKINLVEQNGSKVISSYDFTSSNALEDENAQIEVVINHSCSSVPFVDDERNDSQISLDQYQFKMKSHFQSPNDSKGELIFTSREAQKSLLELDTEKPLKTLNNKQQEFYQSSKAKKSEYEVIDEDDNQLINKTDHELKLNTNSSSVQNTQVSNLIQKTQLFSKFSSKCYLPRLIYLLLILDFFVLSLGIILNTLNYSQLNSNLSNKQALFSMLEAFVTTEYTNNLVIAINLQYHFQDELTAQESLHEILMTNSDDYVERYQQLLHDSLVQKTLSSIELMYFDSQYKTAYNLSAWNEFFAVSYMQKGLKSFSFDQTQNYEFNISLYTLVEQYRLHSEAYAQIQTQFQISAGQDYDNFMKNTENLLIVYVVSQVVFGLFYGLAYFSLRNLQIRIIRTSEQISIQSLQSEQFRCEHLISTYPKSNDLDLHGYPFHIRDKMVQTLQLNNAYASRFTSKFKANQNNNEHKKQLVITDEVPMLQRFTFLTSMITLILFFIYIVSVYIINDSEFQSIQSEFILYLQQISTVEKFATVVFMDTILVNQDILKDNSTYYDQRLIDQYTQQMNNDSAYLAAMSNEYVFGQSSQAFNLLEKLSQDVCSIINNNDDCPTLIDGKLQAGGIYAITYYISIVSDNLGLNYNTSQVHQYTIGEVIAFQYLMEAMREIVKVTREQIYNEIQSIIAGRLSLFIVFDIFLILLQLIQSILTQRNMRHKLYVPRQLPYVLPPQALFGEDSFMKTLVFIQKTYDNMFHY